MTLPARTPDAADGRVQFRTCTADAETGLARSLTLVADADGGRELLPGLSEDAEHGRALLSTCAADCGRAAAAVPLLDAERGRSVQQSCSKLSLAAADEPPHGPIPPRGTASMAGQQFAFVALSMKEEQEVAARAAESRCCA